MAVIFNQETLPALVGQSIGPGEWHEVTQERINEFARASGDVQWIHVDVERAKDGPFGTTIAHGLLTLSIGRLSAAEPPSCCRMPSRAQSMAAAAPAEGAASEDDGSIAPATAGGKSVDADEVAHLGAELFGRHLFAVEVAGVLLLVALVGSIAVVSRGEATETDHRRESR